jgi:alanine-glyoxylate transaminase / serine-glyoxylate transaminase / serine-pyruvate transaminase
MGALDAIRPILLMGPGPSCVPPPVYAAMALPTIGHLDPRFIAVMDQLKDMLRAVMQTANEATVPMSGTGSAGMETCFVNLLGRGDRVLVLSNGVFGARMQDVAGRRGAQVEALEFEWGAPVRVDAARDRLAAADYRLVAIVHAETSTGVRNPVAEVGALLRGRDTLYLVDGVTSLGGIPVEVDGWGADAFYSGTQKCLSCPPGLAPVSLSARAVEAIRGRRTKVPNWYLDVGMILDYWQGARRVYHHTAPVNMLYGLCAALECILREGPDRVHARHLAVHQQLVAGLEALGLQMLVPPECRLPMLNAVVVPPKVDEAVVRRRLLEEHDIEIGAGLGPLAGRVWRIGLMGHTARPENVERLLGALRTLL